MIILAIETSCDDTAVAIARNRKILVNLVGRQLVHAQNLGVVPEVASREHIRLLNPLIKQALNEAKLTLSDIDYFAVTAGPGLMGSLLVGAEVARTLGTITGKPVLGINHLEGHIYANFIPPDVIASKAKQSRLPRRSAPRNDKKWRDPITPALAVLVSGGHSQIILMSKPGSYRIIGETLDDAAGEAFDKVAKLIGLGYPGGPEISKRAETGNDQFINFPIPMQHSRDLNLSFSGLKTSALVSAQKLGKQLKKSETVDDFAASFQYAAVKSIIGKVEMALKQHKVKSILLSGGVAANLRLRDELARTAKTYKVKFFVPSPALCTDNASMIAAAAYFRIKNHKMPTKFEVSSSLTF